MAEALHPGALGCGVKEELSDYPRQVPRLRRHQTKRVTLDSDLANNKQDGNGTAAARAVCAVVFCAFVFCYLFFYQADLLYAEQHVLSGGKTSYDRTVGAVLITVVLMVVQLGVYTLTRINKSAHFITYLPSYLVLTVLTAYAPSADGTFSFGHWSWASLLVLLVFTVIVLLARQMQAVERAGGTGLFSRTMWINMSGMAAMSFLAGALSNGDDVFHYRMKMEMCLVRGDYAGALRAGHDADATDESLTMLRAYALAHEDQLGERLFEYSLAGGSEALQPHGTDARSIVFPDKYIKNMARYKRAVDYKLCGYLLDGDIDAFVRLFAMHYGTGGQRIPKHYREALVLYTRSRSDPAVAYHDDALDEDYKDFLALERDHPDKGERAVSVRDTYEGTYWHYFFYILGK